MIKQKHLNQWLWKWHVIGGLITLPFIFLLAATGGIYLFKADYNDLVYNDIIHVEAEPGALALPYADQLAAVRHALQQQTGYSVTQVLPADNVNQATRFRVHSKNTGQSRSRDMFYVNPYTAEVTGRIQQQQTLMYTIRKLHGELLLGRGGEWLIELIASWAIVLTLTGIYVWWPAKTFSIKGFFTIRTGQGRKLFWRDMHAVLGFWLSLFLLVILAGGMPWTDVFGSQLKWVQAKTETGYPKHWRSSKGLQSVIPLTEQLTEQSTTQAKKTGSALTIDEMIAIAQQQSLPGNITLKLPRKPNGVFSVSNRSFWLQDQQVLHFDQYTGKMLKAHTWQDVGILMDLRQVAMRLHQGEYGLANWLIVLLVALTFAFSTAAGLTSYLLRKPNGRWGIPSVPAQFQVGKVLLIIILALGVLFPLFGLSLVLLWAFEWFKRHVGKRSAKSTGSIV